MESATYEMCGFYCVTKRALSKIARPMTCCTARLSAMSAITCFVNTITTSSTVYDLR